MGVSSKVSEKANKIRGIANEINFALLHNSKENNYFTRGLVDYWILSNVR
jgi:hypothetical protein